ncbi:MAG: sigma-70 family RNA polymerase sigma factor [Cyclobacteriaceae bacterium]
MNPNFRREGHHPGHPLFTPREELIFNETVLWEDFKAGSESAFIKIYESFFDILLNYGCQLTGDRGLTKDSIQDLFIEIRQKREKLGKTDSIKFYLMKSLKRKLVKQLNKNNRFQSLSQSGNIFEITFSHEKMLIDKQIQEEQSKRLNEALKLLSGRKKEVLYYFYFEGLDYEQIRELMDFSHIKSVRNLVYKAVKILKNALQ